LEASGPMVQSPLPSLKLPLFWCRQDLVLGFLSDAKQLAAELAY
jgi:hypothetical protein